MKRFTGYYFNDSSKDDSIELPNTQFSLFWTV
jgi:hypothetical protein